MAENHTIKYNIEEISVPNRDIVEIDGKGQRFIFKYDCGLKIDAANLKKIIYFS